MKATRPKTPAPRPSRWRKRLALCTASVLFALLLAEAAARILGLGRPVYQPRRFEPAAGVPFTTLAGKLLAYQPNATFSSVYDSAGDPSGYFDAGGRVEYRINQFGLRGPDIALVKEAGTDRVLCLGDSFTFGEGVHYPDTYPARLQHLLTAGHKGRRAQVLNAGVQAYGTREAVAFYGLQGYRFRPDVVILGFVLNDATDFAQTIRQNEAQTTEAPLSTPARLSRLWELIERNGRSRRLQREFFATTRRSFRSEKWDDCEDLLVGMEQLSRRDGFRFLVVLFPIFWELDGDYPFADLHALVAAACREADCEFIDLLDVYRGRPARSLWVHPTDHHPNHLAHRLAAERIARHLETQPQ